MSNNEQMERRILDLEKRIRALEKAKREGLWAEEQPECAAREKALLSRYGEFVDKTVAAQILGVTRATVYAMLADGRIKGSCGGKRVNVKSIAAYLCAATREELA